MQRYKFIWKAEKDDIKKGTGKIFLWYTNLWFTNLCTSKKKQKTFDDKVVPKQENALLSVWVIKAGRF